MPSEVELSRPPPGMGAAVTTIADQLRKPYRFVSEFDLQNQIESALLEHGHKFVRECALDLKRRDRIDFYVPAMSLGIGVKIADSIEDVARQLGRYAKHESIQALLLLTSRGIHRALPRTINRKPLEVVHLIGGAF